MRVLNITILKNVFLIQRRYVHVLISVLWAVCTGDDEAQVRGAHLQAVLLQLRHVHLQTLVLPVQLVSHHAHFTGVQVVHDLL